MLPRDTYNSPWHSYAQLSGFDVILELALYSVPVRVTHKSKCDDYHKNANGVAQSPKSQNSTAVGHERFIALPLGKKPPISSGDPA